MFWVGRKCGNTSTLSRVSVSMFLPPSPPMVHGPRLDLFRSPWVCDLSSTSNLLVVYAYTHTICAVTCEKYEHGRVYFYQLQIRSTSESMTSCKLYHILPSPLDLVTDPPVHFQSIGTYTFIMHGLHLIMPFSKFCVSRCAGCTYQRRENQ
jgi:hypothetical protein